MIQVSQALLDQDGILTDFVQGAHDIHNRHDYVYSSPESMGEFDIVKLFGMTKPYFWKPMGEEFWAKLKWTPDGQKIIHAVRSIFGSNFCICTHPSPNYGCVDGKLRWIERELPDIRKDDRWIFTPHKHFCAGPDRLLIDDGDKNVDRFRKKGGHAILYPRPWNKLHRYRDNAFEYFLTQLAKYSFVEERLDEAA